MIKIDDDLYRRLEQAVSRTGLSPKDWVELKINELPNESDEDTAEARKRAAWEEFIGAGGRLPKPKTKRKRTAFGEMLVKKYRKQGLKLDYDTD